MPALELHTFCPFGREMVSEFELFLAALAFFPFFVSIFDFREASFESGLVLIVAREVGPPFAFQKFYTPSKMF